MSQELQSIGASNLVTSPCAYCGEKVVKSGTAEQTHIQNNHMGLSFRCKMCPGAERTCYERLEYVEKHLEMKHFGLGPNKWEQVMMPGDRRHLQGFAWVKCKRPACSFTGVGLEAGTLRHQILHHKGGGIKFFNIFCRLCTSTSGVTKLSEVFEDASDFAAHMKSRHKELYELLPDPH